MDRKRYRRYFIILEEEDHGFENKGGKRPKGYTKIETKNGKGVLSHYIQNLKYFDNAEYVYKGYLIGTKDGKQIFADNGTFVIDESGKGELYWRFNPENVDGQGNAIKEFNVIAIVAEVQNGQRKEIVAPLVGFIDKEKVRWKHVLTNHYKEEKKEENNYEAVKIEEVKEEQTPKEEETVKEDIQKEETIEEEIKNEEKEEIRIDPIKVEKEEIEEEKVEVKEEVKEEIEKDKDEKRNEDYGIDYDQMRSYDCKNPYEHYHQYFKMVCGYVENVLKYYKEVKPFEKNLGNCKWWKIDCSQQTLYRNFLPFYGYIHQMYCYSPYINNMIGCPHLIYKYKHYIFGIMYDKNREPIYYIYGIPGRFILSEQPYEGMTGFVYWHPIEDKKPEKGDYGYWILHIDAKTGNIAVPYKPTIPPR
ncbi:DUF7922 domain-containing protein [Crassaminicella thermophila]|uniref:DUF7922 domain-containing protein n=1 Tax=Crassaminicella thermophila TaxID=2599308 RepID=UPI00143DEE2F|nr:hypothetical protein [Crassaminicella thermophila]